QSQDQNASPQVRRGVGLKIVRSALYAADTSRRSAAIIVGCESGRPRVRMATFRFICHGFKNSLRIMSVRLEADMRFSNFVLIILALAIALTVASTRALSKEGRGPDKAYMQKIWDGWSTLDPANVAEFYASGPHTFFDITPLKYSGWEEYQKGVTKAL